MRNILISIRRRHWENILAGKKRIELRKRLPKDVNIPYVAYVHVCGEQGVAGEIMINRHLILTGAAYNHPEAADLACVTFRELLDYFGNRNICAMCIEYAGKYRTSQPISDFVPSGHIPQSWCYAEEGCGAR